MTGQFRRLLPLLATVAALLIGGRAAAQVAQPAPPDAASVLVNDVQVRGNQRIDAATIELLSSLQVGNRVTSLDIQTAIRRLMGTGNFESVSVFAEGDQATGVTLVIEVVERPVVMSFQIEGLERLNPRTVRDTVGLTGNQPLDPQLIVDTERTIRDMLAAQGIQLASFDTVWVPIPDQPNAIDLVFRVEEGNRLAIAEVVFEGNEAFPSEVLREAIKTKSEGFFWFRQGRFDRAVFEEDLLTNLPRFYGSRGYIDFAVVSDTIIVDPQTGKARVVIAVDEGPQYRLGEFSVEGVRHFPTQEIQRMFTERSRSVLGLPFGRNEAEQGEIFDRAALEDATTRVAQLYRNEGYLFVDVQPIIERVEGPDGQPMVDVRWMVNEGSPFFVGRIDIEGNTYTHESVIRDRLVLLPGDLYSDDRMIQSYRSIAALGFFETPLPNPDIEPHEETGTVDITFRVEERQTGSINFGTSIGGGGYGYGGGLSGFIGYSQPNLFGQAKEASLQAEYGYGRSSFQAAYTDPSIMGTRNSASISVFHTDDRYRGVSFTDGRYVRTGVSLRYGFPILDLRWTRAFAGYSLSRYRYEARNFDDCEPGNIFCQPSALASNLSLAVTRDTKDHPLFPVSGSRQSISVQQTGGPLGGDGNFQKVLGEAEWWTPVGRIGGSQPGSRPFMMTFGLIARAGSVFGDASRFPLERFFLGGTQFGEQLRGYDESTITPLGYFDRDVNISSSNRLGDSFLTVTGEFAIRFNDNISVSAFADVGNIWNDPADINPSRLYRGIGLGAVIVTPFGPFGLDYAYGFDRDPPGWKFHFKINQPGF